MSTPPRPPPPPPKPIRNAPRKGIPVIRVIALFVMASGILQIWFSRPRPPQIEEECRARYERIYAFEEPHFTVAFGYKDARPARFVGDRYERALLTERLLERCPEKTPQGACGFARDPADADRLHRTLNGPDGRPRHLSVELLHSSSGPDDQENRDNPHQVWLSEYARRRFLKGVQSSTVVLYNGHSRVGGGPDFEPPQVNSAGGILYDAYKTEETGLRDLLNALREPGTEIELLGLLSCASNQLFEERLHKAKRGLSIWSSRELLYFADALDDAWNILDALIQMKCRPDFERIEGMRPNQAGSRISGFYEN